MSTFYFFAYGSLRRGHDAAHMMRECEYISTAAVHGTLYDINGEYTALMLYGQTEISADIWRCPAARLASLDTYEGVDSGRFRRIATNVVIHRDNSVEHLPCWLYVAGPQLAHLLTPASRLDSR
jgi:gamma-glutamylcyclotransferase (GGCT)/AIG2-like uncharacterized protein YtfP